MKTIELNVKKFGVIDAIKNAFNTDDVEVLVSQAYGDIPFCCDWRYSDKPLTGVADMICKINGVKTYFAWI